MLQSEDKSMDMKTFEHLEGLTEEQEAKMQRWMQMGHLAFLGVAVSSALHGGLALFKYESASAYYTAYNTYAGTTYVDSQLLSQWTAFVVGTILSITEILAILGIGTEINMMAWAFGLMAMNIAGSLVFLARAYGMNDMYNKYYGDKTGTNASTYYTVYEVYRANIVTESVMSTAAGFTLMSNGLAWMMGNMYMLCGSTWEGCGAKMAEKNEATKMLVSFVSL